MQNKIENNVEVIDDTKVKKLWDSITRLALLMGIGNAATFLIAILSPSSREITIKYLTDVTAMVDGFKSLPVEQQLGWILSVLIMEGGTTLAVGCVTVLFELLEMKRKKRSK